MGGRVYCSFLLVFLCLGCPNETNFGFFFRLAQSNGPQQLRSKHQVLLFFCLLDVSVRYSHNTHFRKGVWTCTLSRRWRKQSIDILLVACLNPSSSPPETLDLTRLLCHFDFLFLTKLSLSLNLCADFFLSGRTSWKWLECAQLKKPLLQYRFAIDQSYKLISLQTQ